MNSFALIIAKNIHQNVPPNQTLCKISQSKMKLSVQSVYLLVIVSFPLIQLHKIVEANEYDECHRTFQCGNLTLSYPFYDEQQSLRPAYCGYPGFEVDCSDEYGRPEISLNGSSSKTHYLLHIDTVSHTISVVQEDFWNGSCPDPETLYNTTLNSSLFHYTSSVQNFTLYYECPSNSPSSINQFSCPNINADRPIGYFVPPSSNSYPSFYNVPPDFCQRSILIPVNQSLVSNISNIQSFEAALHGGFELNWIADNQLCDNCGRTGGKCGSKDGRFACYVKGRGPPLTNSQIEILASITGTGIAICTLIALGLYSKKRYSSKKSQDVEVFLKKHGSPSPKRYTYSDLKKITSSFKDKLGEGGYGVVYRGKLHDGHQVAVKLLKKSSKDNMEEFINEVASIGKTNHVNIVKLLGFCYEGGKKRALMYNYLPNGSLEKFTDAGQKNNQPLSWEKLFEIAVGIARGLEYLHRGCDTRILHFDIKPQNILLDENFCPKISDFGLAKLCLQQESIISISEARGTIGYIAPEVFFKRIGGVSYKSDVYSYGMLVLEMVGCRNNADTSEECDSEQYFPDWIYKQLEQVQEGILNSVQGLLRRKLVLVSLWCIQTNPINRPHMTRVVEMLEGELESLQIPPIPSLASPLITQQNSSTISIGQLFQE